MASCKSCGAEIVWALTIAGRRMPVDAKPAAAGEGAVVLAAMGDPSLTDGRGQWLALMAASINDNERAVLTRVETVLHHAHWATCPNADEHRKKAA